MARSGLLTTSSLIALLAVCGTVWMAHVKGRIHKLTTTQEAPEAAVVTVRPGGQDLIHLNRSQISGSMVPEFASATLAPGYGMLLFQALLNLPGRGEVPILLGTREADLASAGPNLVGADFSALAEVRQGTRWSAPVELIAKRMATQQSGTVLPGGSRSDARFAADVPTATGSVVHTGIESGVSASVTGRGLEVSISARNTSKEVRAVTVEWHPAFLVPQAGITSLYLRLPAGAAEGRPQDSEQQLGLHDYDQVFSSLSHSYLSAGPEVRLRNQTDGYTLRLTALTPSIRSVHIKAALHSNAVLVAFSTASGSKADEARSLLQPGEELQWRVRVDVVPNVAYTAPAL